MSGKLKMFVKLKADLGSAEGGFSVSGNPHRGLNRLY